MPRRWEPAEALRLLQAAIQVTRVLEDDQRTRDRELRRAPGWRRPAGQREPVELGREGLR